jgi:transketolase
VGDATDVESLLDAIQPVNGPVYVRMLRGAIPRLFPPDEPLQLNRARVLSRGSDIALLSSGICTEEALRATSLLRACGLSILHLHVSTLKPFTDPQVVEAAAKARHGVVTMENHSVIGGLGTAVAEVMAENGIGTKLARIGINDTFAHGASLPYLMKEHGLDAMSLVNRIEALLGGESFKITEDDLAAVRLDTSASEGQLEAL